MLGAIFENTLLGGHKPIHVATQEERIGDPANDPERRFPLEGVVHEGCAVAGFELVNVAETLERAVNHFIHEAGGAVDLGYASDESLSDTEVAAFKRDEVAKFEQALCSARLDHAFGRECSRFGVSAHITRDIEAQLDRRMDPGFDNDRWHHSAVAESIPPT